jgi:mannose-6-phosphate isomerase
MIEFDNRPWGRWEEYLNEPGYRVKRIIVYPGKRLSLQKHLHRMEHWAIVAGEGLMTLDATTYKVIKGDVVLINKEQVHRIENTGLDYLVFIETQLGLCIEDDIIRIEDDWGRTSPTGK